MIELPTCFLYGAMIFPSEQFLMIHKLDSENPAGWTQRHLHEIVKHLIMEQTGIDDLLKREWQTLVKWFLYRWVEFEFVVLAEDGAAWERLWTGDPDAIEDYMARVDITKATNRIMRNLSRMGIRRRKTETFVLHIPDARDADEFSAQWTIKLRRKRKKLG